MPGDPALGPHQFADAAVGRIAVSSRITTKAIKIARLLFFIMISLIDIVPPKRFRRIMIFKLPREFKDKEPVWEDEIVTLPDRFPHGEQIKKGGFPLVNVLHIEIVICNRSTQYTLVMVQ